tara:strand:+ start:139 stop:435 length:297 start_codon:yes stop_codon:yes gene_type:complete
MDAKTVNKLLMGGGCLMVAFALYYGGKSESKVEIKEKVKESDYILPEKFKNHVNQMSNEELDKSIEANTKYLETSQMLPETREAIGKMLDYLKQARGK